MKIPSFLLAAISVPVLVASCSARDPDPVTEPALGYTLPKALWAIRDDLPHNALTPEALTSGVLGGSRTLLDGLSTGALSTENLGEMAGDQDVADSLDETYTRDLMKYIAYCALERGDEVRYPVVHGEDVEGKTVTWPGDLGLCPAWAGGPPSDACIERVSSCLLALTNARGKKVVVSFRGGAEQAPLRDSVPVELEYREEHGTPIASFGECHLTDGERKSGIYDRPDCGWIPLHVGRCAAGEQVTLTTGPDAAPPGSSICDETLRVCEGLYGCDMADAETNERAYSSYPPGQQVKCDDDGLRVLFTCPSNGPDGSGYYSMMFRHRDLERAYTEMQVVAMSKSLAVAEPGASEAERYPALEKDVFTFREGAFYGDVFSKMPELTKEPLSGQMYACFSEGWVCGLATITDRYCAKSSDVGGECSEEAIPDCFANVPVACSGEGSDVCTLTAEGDVPFGKYNACTGGGETWESPVTVFLNNPCDLSGPGCDPTEIAFWKP